MSCILCQQTLRRGSSNQAERGKTLPSRVGKELEQESPTGFENIKELKVGCNADNIGYEWKPRECYLFSSSRIITAFMQKEGDKSDY